ncbi:putative N-acetylgalactosaminyltransferase 8 [Aphelenchoides fujianensis]|nr:putative N-acetylgalactosaminyltransferase 8 [Aphelenchoides fujianensis]
MRSFLHSALLCCSLFFLSASSAFGEEAEEAKKLPECPYIDPAKDVQKWKAFDRKSCNVSLFKPAEESEEFKIYQWGSDSFSFNSYVSDKIGPFREIPVTYHKNCENLTYSDLKLKASILIIYHNEAFSVLIRMITGIFERTPPELLHEIILYDDASVEEHVIEPRLKEYAQLAGWSKLKFVRNPKRQGLIRAKVLAAREASADVIVFLDSHCEVNKRWLEPLLQTIQGNRNTIVLPIVDLIQPYNFEYSQAMVAKGGFDWALNFRWEYFDWSYFDVEENNVKPFDSPAMSGGLVAVDREFFRELGEFDMSMEIWGGENVELSIRAWLCGGGVKIAPCSRVGHVFRMRRPYKGVPGVDTNALNTLRTAKVFLGEWEEHYFNARPRARKMDAGDLSERLELKARLNCKPFTHFIENIYPKLKPTRHEEL